MRAECSRGFVALSDRRRPSWGVARDCGAGVEHGPAAADIIEVYLHPSVHAAVFCVDGKTAIQSLYGNDPVLPLSPGRAEPHGSSNTCTARWRCTRGSIRRPAKC